VYPTPLAIVLAVGPGRARPRPNAHHFLLARTRARARPTGYPPPSKLSTGRDLVRPPACHSVRVPRITTVLSRSLTSATALKGRTRLRLARRRRLRTMISSG
jgi:hypothetical protein